MSRRPGRLLLLAGLFTALLAFPASHLRFETDLAGLLPAGGPAVAGYRAYLDRFGGAETVFVVVEIPGQPAPSPEDLADVSEALAAALGASPEVPHAMESNIAHEPEGFVHRRSPQG